MEEGGGSGVKGTEPMLGIRQVEMLGQVGEEESFKVSRSSLRLLC